MIRDAQMSRDSSYPIQTMEGREPHGIKYTDELWCNPKNWNAKGNISEKNYKSIKQFR